MESRDLEDDLPSRSKVEQGVVRVRSSAGVVEEHSIRTFADGQITINGSWSSVPAAGDTFDVFVNIGDVFPSYQTHRDTYSLILSGPPTHPVTLHIDPVSTWTLDSDKQHDDDADNGGGPRHE